MNRIKNDFPFNTAVISFYDEGFDPLDMKGKPVAEISKCINDIRWVGNPREWHRKDLRILHVSFTDVLKRIMTLSVSVNSAFPEVRPAQWR